MLKNFGSGTQERDRAIRNTKVRGLIGFKDREDKGMFPDSGEVSMVEGEVKKRSKEEKTLGTEVFQMKVRKAIGTKSRRVFRKTNSVGSGGSCGGREVGG